MPAAPEIETRAVADSDFEALAELRVAAMRESLERVGRFDRERARERLRSTFVPEHTHFIVCRGQPVGFYTLRPETDGLRLDHFYIHPDHQNRGIGGAMLKAILAQADSARVAVRVGALKESASNRFYQRYGFIRESEGEWDIYYLRPLRNLRSRNG